MNQVQSLLSKLQIQPVNAGIPGASKSVSALPQLPADVLTSTNPATLETLAAVSLASETQVFEVVKQAQTDFLNWRLVPAPKRGELVRAIGQELRIQKDDLALLITLEMGKTIQEARGEVQEMIDMADFAVGLSRQLYGLTIVSERFNHRLQEQWHPLGVVGIITAFNFPMAVWSWNAFLAAICGNISLWKPSLQTPLCAIALQHICDKVSEKLGYSGVFQTVIASNNTVGATIVKNPGVHLVSFTGSTQVGRTINQQVAARFGKILLELGGNNALYIDASAHLPQAIPSVVFGAVGTSGQRCTTTRRLLVHADIYDMVLSALIHAYKQVQIGNPATEQTHMGPLVSQNSIQLYTQTITEAVDQGGKCVYGNLVLQQAGCFVLPTLIEAHAAMPILAEERFVPVLYIIKVSGINEAIQLNNNVNQGLSSAIFTNNFQQVEQFISAAGSDCGIANVNTGTSGAEIGGAFGGEKHTGGGRESGSDAWKAYMRRQTNTINRGNDLPLAQGISFSLE